MDTGLHLNSAAKRVTHRLCIIGENRLQLLLVEVQEERERALLAIMLALGVAAFGLLAGMTLTVVIVVMFWKHSPVITLFVVTTIYAVVAGIFYTRLMHLLRDWQTLPETLAQLRKDRKCLEKKIS